MNKRRTGKVARLPITHRELVNRCLKEGVAYNLIAAKLKTLGHPEITEQNIQNWKQGGYLEWLEAKERKEFLLKQSVALMQTGENSEAIANGVTVLGISQLWSVLTEFDPTVLKKRLAERPECYFDLVLAFSRFLNTRFTLHDRLANMRGDKRFSKWWDNFMDEMLADSEAAAIRRKKASQQQEQDEKQEDQEEQQNQQETAAPADRVSSPSADPENPTTNNQPPPTTNDQRPATNDQ